MKNYLVLLFELYIYISDSIFCSRLPPLDAGVADMNAELRAMTEHAHNHRPNVRVLHSSPTRTSESSSKPVNPNDSQKCNISPQVRALTRPSQASDQSSCVSRSRSPSPPQHSSPIRQSPSPPNRSSPSPILQRPGSATRRFTMGRTNSVSFLEQEDDNESSEEDDANEEGVKSC